MRSSNKPPINLDQFLVKTSGLERLLESSRKLSDKTRKNIHWYCEYRVHQYCEKYLNKENMLKYKKYRLGAGHK